ncbi:MAG: hypothetical protein EA381_00320 [Planctomycetaceae bacterium]|nr:MAG: hypothetical protein EA381_00320 [Planctomycetaceae bacterium]
MFAGLQVQRSLVGLDRFGQPDHRLWDDSRQRLGSCGKKVFGTFCAKHPKGEFLAKGSGHFFTAHCL